MSPDAEGATPPGSGRLIFRRELGFFVGLAGILVAFFAYYAVTWRSFAGFSGSIDTCGTGLCDFVEYYFPMGQAIFHSPLPVPGFVYSPFMAILMSAFPPLGLAKAILLWGALQASAVAAYIVLFRRLIPADRKVQLLFVALVVSSFPVLHNISWGQVGIFTTVAVLAALALLKRRPVVAACALALAASFKYFPLAFLAPLAFRREGRALLLAIAACSGVLFVVPALVLGPADTFRFYRGLLDAYRGMDWVAANYNSQFFPHVALRYADAARFGGAGSLALFRAISYVIAALNLVLAYLVHKVRLPHADLLSNLLVFLTIPFVLTTSWPSDLAFLPFAQGLLAWWMFRPSVQVAPGVEAGSEASPPQGAQRPRKAAALLMLGGSIVVSNVLFFNLIGSRMRYGAAGFVFWAVLLLVVAAYLDLGPAVWGRLGRAARRVEA